jgi:ribosomal protein S18 acetylase RimI-like enzyme
MTLEIRAASPSDHRLFHELNAHVQRLHHAARPDLFKAPSEVRSSGEEFAALIGKSGVSIWFAFAGGEPVGYVYVEERERPEDELQRAQRSLYVHQLSVRPEARRLGVGTALMQQALASARAAGVMRVELDVWAFNEGARELYRRLGYEPWIERLALEVG